MSVLVLTPAREKADAAMARLSDGWEGELIVTSRSELLTTSAANS